MKDLMIDLETLGTERDAMILSIGYCWFDVDSGRIKEPVTLYPTLVVGKIDPRTVMWWMSQDDTTRREITEAPRGRSLHNCLQEIERECGNATRVWAKSATFDINILNYRWTLTTGAKSIVDFWKVRDCRSMYDLLAYNNTPPPEQQMKHSAGADAAYQAWVVCDVYNKWRM